MFVNETIQQFRHLCIHSSSNLSIMTLLIFHNQLIFGKLPLVVGMCCKGDKWIQAYYNVIKLTLQIYN